MGDQDHRLALIPQPRQNPEQMIRLLGRQHPRRLVQDQDIGTAVQRLQNLDPLLMAHRQILDHRIGVNVQIKLGAQRLQFLAGPRQAGGQHRAILGPQNDVLQHGKVLHQLEMLENHPDAGAYGALAVGDGRQPAAHEYLTGIGLVKPVQDRHQRRLARTVFADDAVNGATRHPNVDVLIGLHRAKCLGYAPQFNGIG